MGQVDKSKATKIIADLGALFGMEKEVINMTSELAEGEYTLEDGTKFRIDAEGNLVDVVAPDAAVAEAEEAAKVEEEVAMAKAKKLEAAKLEAANKEIAELKAENLQLSKTPKAPIVPPKAKVYEPIQMTADMTYNQRVAARTKNLLNKQ